MKIIIDSDIPYLEGLFEPHAEVIYLKGATITALDVADADALIVRTRTRCDRALLAGSAVRMIATATIGTDHIDLDYCAQRGITVRSASGSNARAVAQWVLAAINACGASGTIGIIGVGNVGSEVEAMARCRGFEVLRCDPPRSERSESGFISTDELLELSDIVTLHVPLLPTTQRMIDEQFLSKMRHGSLLLNSSRGEISDETAMLGCDRINYAIDVWMDEPNINLALMDRAKIATPHIAGYSARGKARATQKVVNSVAEFFAIEELISWQPRGEFAIEEPEAFDIMFYDRELRQSPQLFERQRIIRT